MDMNPNKIFTHLCFKLKIKINSYLNEKRTVYRLLLPYSQDVALHDHRPNYWAFTMTRMRR